MLNLRSMITAVLAAATLAAVAAASEEAATVQSARLVLKEIMATPEKQIPVAMLADAQGVAIVPGVIKIGFIAGVRRGHGVVLSRDKDGAWGLPQFITLTGGSVGWQAGAQATDVVLVFRTQKSLDGLMRGKFTIGADAEVAAGPVGRRIEAATDVQLKAEIYAYSRSRGLFAGVALDGSALQIDHAAQQAYYGPPNVSSQVPEGAIELAQFVATLAAGPQEAQQPVQPPNFAQPAPVQPSVRNLVYVAPPTVEVQRRELADAARHLYPLLNDEWRRFLALPAEVFTAAHPPSPAVLNAALKQFDAVAQNPQYRALTERPEFRATYDALQRYAAGTMAEVSPKLNLPPPPAAR